MKKILEFTDTLTFWLLVFLVSVIAVFAYAWTNNRQTVATDSALLREQQTQLSYLCETIAVLDQLTVQEKRLTKETLNDPNLPLSMQVYLSKQLTLFETTHLELEQSRGCRIIE